MVLKVELTVCMLDLRIPGLISTFGSIRGYACFHLETGVQICSASFRRQINRLPFWRSVLPRLRRYPKDALCFANDWSHECFTGLCRLPQWSWLGWSCLAK